MKAHAFNPFERMFIPAQRQSLAAEIRQVPTWQCVMLAVFSVSAIAAIRYLLSPWLGERPALVLFILPVILCAYLGGLRAGLAATILSGSIAFFWFLPNQRGLSIRDPMDWVQWGTLVLACSLVSTAFEWLHQSQRVTAKSLRELQRTEQALAKSEDYLKLVIDNMTEGVVVADATGQLVHWNQAALQMHDFQNSEDWCLALAEFTDLFELSDLKGRTLELSEWPMSRVLAGERLVQCELRVRRKDKDWQRIFNYGGRTVVNTKGDTLAFLTLSDITERKEMELALAQTNQILEQRVQERTREMEYTIRELEAFTYSVSHDLRAPLRAIDGFSELALEDYGKDLPEEGRHYLQTIRDSAQRMRNLIEDLLAFSRISRASVQWMDIDTARMVREVVQEQVMGHTDTKADFRIGDLPPMRGDHSLLKQVWSNLIENAIKYSSKSEAPIVEIGSEVIEGSTTYFVRDNGIGFDMAYVDKLFEVFQRLHRPDQYDGTGVGLAVVQRVVNRHGGRVWAAAKEGEGATFYFTIGGEEKE